MIMLLDIDKNKLKEIMKSFYTLTHIRIAIINIEYHEIIAYPEHFTEFCTYMRANKTSCLNCEECDLQAFERCKKSGELCIYKCHAGLTEAANPLKINETIIGYIMFGQVTDIKDKQSLSTFILSRCEKYDINQTNLKKVIRKLEYKSEEELIAAATFFETSIYYILQKQLISARGEQIVLKLDRCIENNMANHLDVSTIAKELLISRTQLYHLTHQYLAIGIAEYIRNKRLNKAKELLKNTTLSFMEISEQVGYSDYNYFRRIFKKCEGTSLKLYRNQIDFKQF